MDLLTEHLGVRIPLANDRGFVVVDAADAQLVSQYRWQLRQGRKPGYTSYASRRLSGATQYIHTFLTGWPEVDHEDGDGLNNCRSNLRPATRGQNNANQGPQDRPGKLSTFKGVTWYATHERWVARIRVDGRLRSLGYFTSEEAAARAYDNAAQAAWPGYAYLNFPAR
jgi:hypothetical protein